MDQDQDFEFWRLKLEMDQDQDPSLTIANVKNLDNTKKNPTSHEVYLKQ